MMFILLLSVLIISGALSTQFKIIDLFAACVWVIFVTFVAAFFNDIYPEAPHIWFASEDVNHTSFAFDAGKVIDWVIANGSPLANLLMYSPIVYLSVKACLEIFQAMKLITEVSRP